MGVHTILWEGHFTPEDKARSDYAYIPLDLPAPAQRLTVRYTYADAARAEGGNAGPPSSVVDIGLFDPRGTAFPEGPGFRGWSGSARREFTVGVETATPGYLPGPLPPGRYHVILGLYRIHPAGVDVRIQVTVEPAAGDGAGRSCREAWVSAAPLDYTKSPAQSPGQWLRGDLHTHTWHSDAEAPPAQLLQEAQALGLHFLAVTDHNTVSHHRELAQLAHQGLVLIPGQEVTTYYGHMNVWGAARWCDFRCRTPQEMAQVIAQAHQAGGLCSLNHPKPGGPPWEYGFHLPVDAMEVWHTPWPFGNPQILATWDQLLGQGRRLPGVGGSDYHCRLPSYAGIRHLAMPTTWVWTADPTPQGILAAIRQGRVCISAGPTGPRLELEATTPTGPVPMGGTVPQAPGRLPLTVRVLAGVGFELRLVADGEVVFRHPITREGETVRPIVPVRRYVRAELVGEMPARLLPKGAPPDLDRRAWRWALSNPIYLAGT